MQRDEDHQRKKRKHKTKAQDKYALCVAEGGGRGRHHLDDAAVLLWAHPARAVPAATLILSRFALRPVPLVLVMLAPTQPDPPHKTKHNTLHT